MPAAFAPGTLKPIEETLLILTTTGRLLPPVAVLRSSSTLGNAFIICGHRLLYIGSYDVTLFFALIVDTRNSGKHDDAVASAESPKHETSKELAPGVRNAHLRLMPKNTSIQQMHTPFWKLEVLKCSRIQVLTLTVANSTASQKWNLGVV